MGGNQNLIHMEDILPATEEAGTVDLAKQDDAESVDLVGDALKEETKEVLTEVEDEQCRAGEFSAEKVEKTEKAVELPGREMPEQEKVVLASRMAVEPRPTVTDNVVSIAEPEKKTEPEKKAPPDVNDSYLNQYVLDVIKTYQIGNGRYPYLLNNDYANYNGVTSTLSYKGKVLLKAHSSGSRASHCVGITFEVFFKAMQERNRQMGISPDDFNGMSWDNLFDLALNWFVASGSKSTNNIVLAVEKYGVGKGINRLEDAQPGDFIDFNRVNGTGHTVVFMNWIMEGDRIIGFRYWSSQGSTGGINYKDEYFKIPGKNGNVIMNPIYIVRILPVRQYK